MTRRSERDKQPSGVRRRQLAPFSPRSESSNGAISGWLTRSMSRLRCRCSVTPLAKNSFQCDGNQERS